MRRFDREYSTPAHRGQPENRAQVKPEKAESDVHDGFKMLPLILLGWIVGVLKKIFALTSDKTSDK